MSHVHNDPKHGKGLAGNEALKGQNAPSDDDLKAMRDSNAAVQTIGPNVTITIFRKDKQVFGVVDAGDPAKIPSLKAQKIKIIEDPELVK